MLLVQKEAMLTFAITEDCWWCIFVIIAAAIVLLFFACGLIYRFCFSGTARKRRKKEEDNRSSKTDFEGVSSFVVNEAFRDFSTPPSLAASPAMVNLSVVSNPLNSPTHRNLDMLDLDVGNFPFDDRVTDFSQPIKNPEVTKRDSDCTVAYTPPDDDGINVDNPVSLLPNDFVLDIPPSQPVIPSDSVMQSPPVQKVSEVDEIFSQNTVPTLSMSRMRSNFMTPRSNSRSPRVSEAQQDIAD